LAFQGHPQILSYAGGVAIDIRFSMNHLLTIYYCNPYANTAASISLTISSTCAFTRTITPTNTATFTPNPVLNTPLFGGINSGAGKVRDTGPIHYQLNI